jgi:hypothetical protein
LAGFREQFSVEFSNVVEWQGSDLPNVLPDFFLQFQQFRFLVESQGPPAVLLLDQIAPATILCVGPRLRIGMTHPRSNNFRGPWFHAVILPELGRHHRWFSFLSCCRVADRSVDPPFRKTIRQVGRSPLPSLLVTNAL